jgi:hypothetical protein
LTVTGPGVRIPHSPLIHERKSLKSVLKADKACNF